MPNHVTHRLQISGPAEKIKAFKEAFLSIEEDSVMLDFERIIPMPEIISKTVSGYTIIDGQTVSSWIEEEIDGKRVKRLPTEEEQKLLAEAGAANWYDWSCQNWGTKWNSYSGTWQYEDGADQAKLTFDTAWSTPDPIFEAIALRPEAEGLTIEIVAFDEGWIFAFTGKIEDGAYTGKAQQATAALYEQVYGEPPEEDEEEEGESEEA